MTKNVLNAIGSQMSMQSSVFGRLGTFPFLLQIPTTGLTLAFTAGVTCQAWLYGELFLQCYASPSPVEDVVHCICKSAFLVRALVIRKHQSTESFVQLSQKGRYEDALARMEEIEEETLQTLRYSQYWTSSLGLLKFRRHLHRCVVPQSSCPL